MLAKKIAANSAVLLKNEGNILPIAKGEKVTLIGALAKAPRYQGAGSSHITPTKLSTLLDGFNSLGWEYSYFDGYPLRGPGEEALLAEAATDAGKNDIAVIVAGLPEAYESEGFDRETMCMPESHNLLISRVAEANPNTVVVLVGGAPVEMPWVSEVKAVLNLYLSGQAGGLAAAELLTGAINPSGKLAESYPIRYADVPSAGLYETSRKQAQYREGIYVGYRYYEKAHKEVLFPFGHGLSYTTFEYSDLQISPAELEAPDELNVSLSVSNTGSLDGAEVVQVYVGAPDSPVFRPVKELKEFAKLFLRAGETKRVDFRLDARAFAIYDVQESAWVVPSGRYQIAVGASSQDVRLQGEVDVHGQEVRTTRGENDGWYANPAGTAAQADFELLLGRQIEEIRPWRMGEYSLACSFNDMQDSFIVRQISKYIEKRIIMNFGGADYNDPTFKMIIAGALNTPLRGLSLTSPDHMPRHVTQGIVHLANGKFIQAIQALIQKPKD
jgi:beta-glucosidase